MMDYLGSLDSSRDLQMSFVIYFVISLCLVLQMQEDTLSKILHSTTKQGPCKDLLRLIIKWCRIRPSATQYTARKNVSFFLFWQVLFLCLLHRRNPIWVPERRKYQFFQIHKTPGPFRKTVINQFQQIFLRYPMLDQHISI